MFFEAIYEITLITAVLATISQIIQNKFVDRDKMKQKQEEMKEKQKKIKELMTKKDQKSANELEALEKEMLETMQEMMSGSSKVMIASMVIFLPAFFLLGMFYGDVIIALPIPIPWLAQGFDLFNLSTWGIELYTETNWFGWYFLSYLVIVLILNMGRNMMKKMNEKK